MSTEPSEAPPPPRWERDSTRSSSRRTRRSASRCSCSRCWARTSTSGTGSGSRTGRPRRRWRPGISSARQSGRRASFCGVDTDDFARAPPRVHRVSPGDAPAVGEVDDRRHGASPRRRRIDPVPFPVLDRKAARAASTRTGRTRRPSSTSSRSWRARRGSRKTPSWRWNPLDPSPTGLSFGRPGSTSVALMGGLVTRQFADPPAFRAVVRHELAHLRNRDVDLTYATLSLWYAFLLVERAAVRRRRGRRRRRARSLSLGWRLLALAASST